MMKTIPLRSLSELADFYNKVNKPRHNGVLLFKHSTRCFISKMVLNQLEKDWHYSEEELPVFLIDVIKDRGLSNQIAEIYAVRHESPQILLIKDESCLGNASHSDASIKMVDNWMNG